MNDVPTRVLRETLAARIAPAPTSGCIDADTLAAWSDGALGARERAAAESHASSCARCQALLAAMARTAPPAPARRWWHAPTLKWLAPLAAAATAVVVWITVPRARPERTVPAAQAAAQASPQARSAPETSPRAAAASAPPIADARPRAGADEQRAAGAKDVAQSRPRAAQTNAAASSAARDAAAAPPPPARAEPAPPAAAADAAPGTLTFAAPPPAPPARRIEALRAQVLAKAVDVPTQIVSPNPTVRWRLVTGVGVERSIDGGMTWQPQSTGVTATPTAGAAPSPTICWLVGPGGLVLLSIEGRTWQRVPFPEAIDLTSVRASDGANATVTAADGRTFITSDGGKTWR